MKIKLQYDVEINNQYHKYNLRIEYIKTNSILFKYFRTTRKHYHKNMVSFYNYTVYIFEIKGGLD